MYLHGKKVLVIGLGKTGVATVKFLLKEGAIVSATDEKPASELKDAFNALRNLDVNLQTSEQSIERLSEIDLVIPSPGVPPFKSPLYEAVTKNIPILSEIELASRFLKRQMIAITGTNGKTTTTRLLGKILEKAGKKVFVGGNIGNPLIDYVSGKQEDDYVVVEVSSFQLQWIKSFRPFISILLNVTRDHIDYHETFEEYREVKERIFKNQIEGDLAIFNADDLLSMQLSKRFQAGVMCFSSSSRQTKGIYLDRNVLLYNDLSSSVKDEQYPLEMIKLPGVHNVENVMAAVLAARRCGCNRPDIIAAVEDFKGLPHRIEFAGQKGGVKFYNDSKATNVGATVRALETFSEPIILLLGGRDKGGDFRVLSWPISEKVQELILFGEAGKYIKSLVGGRVPTKLVASLKEAILLAHKRSSSGDVVLLSPGCASFDEFVNYEERGRFFKEVVRNL